MITQPTDHIAMSIRYIWILLLFVYLATTRRYKDIRVNQARCVPRSLFTVFPELLQINLHSLNHMSSGPNLFVETVIYLAKTKNKLFGFNKLCSLFNERYFRDKQNGKKKRGGGTLPKLLPLVTYIKYSSFEFLNNF